MVKAAHGGGGKGMRVAYNDKDCLDGYRYGELTLYARFFVASFLSRVLSAGHDST